MSAQKILLSNGRLRLLHGPIDLTIGADGDAAALQAAHEDAWDRFQTVLAELVQELPTLRRSIGCGAANELQGPVARRMWEACAPLLGASGGFITPMAAVAGAIAHEIALSYQRPGIERAWVNNGGDIALHLTPGSAVRVGLVSDLARFDAADEARAAPLPIDGRFELPSTAPVRGVATSGWRGRSFSFGIADSVTVLAASAAAADAAATIIANCVNIDDARIVRQPANQLKDDSDLGARPVTIDVPLLAPGLVRAALNAGLAKAAELQAARLIDSAVLVCQQRFMTTAGFDPGCVDGPLIPVSGGALLALH
ncbi:MAG: UPF0280 family protein [Burkholderiales bacterium]